MGEITRSRMLRAVSIVDVPITATNMPECLEFLQSNIDRIRGEYICVSNVHTTVMAHDDPTYFAVQDGAILTLPDGKPLSLIGRRTIPTMDRVTGPDLMRELFCRSADAGYRHFFYGSTAQTLADLKRSLEVRYPGLRIAGMEPSVFRELSDIEVDSLCARIEASGADFLWVGLGAPRQEELCARIRGRLSSVAIGVGGAFNILSGRTPEAPQWLQDASLEWLYRLVQEPKRLLRRYLVTNSKFILYVICRVPRRRD